MPVPAPPVLRAVSDGLGFSEGMTQQYYRVLREAGLVAKGRPGRGGSHAMVDTRDVVHLIVAILSTETVARAADACTHVAGLAGPELAYVRSVSENLLCIMAPRGATFGDALINLINASRCLKTYTELSDCTGGFRDMRVRKSGDEVWAEIDVASFSKGDVLRTAGPGYDSGAHPATRAIYAKPPPSDEPPKWAIPDAMIRTTSITSLVLSRVADALGPFEGRPEWPKFERRPASKPKAAGASPLSRQKRILG